MTLLESVRPLFLMLLVLPALMLGQSFAQDSVERRLSPRDVVRITVFQKEDLQVDAIVADDGAIDYPLAGVVIVGGMTLPAAKQKLVQVLRLNGIDIDARQLTLERVSASAMRAQTVPANDKGDYRLGPGDALRVAVFQNPDLTLEARISDSGTITYPLIGVVELGGLSVVAAEQKLAALLRQGRYVADPQLSITLLQVRGSQVSLLGLVNKPGRYPLEQTKMRLTDVLALGGGVVQGAADNIVLVGTRNGKLLRKTVDVASMILKGGTEDDLTIQNGDILYVNKAPVFYIFGEVQRPGSYRIERDMTLMQALATGGGITQRGTLRGIKIYRRDESTGKGQQIELDMQDAIRPDDVISIRETWF